MPGQAPKEVQGPGYCIVAISGADPTKVMIQWTDPEWWVHFTPDEARNLAGLLYKKASECEEMLRRREDN